MARPLSRPALFLIGYAMQRQLEARMAAASVAMSDVPGVGTGPMGLTPDAVKASPAYSEARARYQAAHAALANHNRTFVRTFGRELSATRNAIREARRAAAMVRG